MNKFGWETIHSWTKRSVETFDVIVCRILASNRRLHGSSRRFFGSIACFVICVVTIERVILHNARRIS